jgi:hypothetical protein
MSEGTAESAALSFNFCIKINRWDNKISLLQRVSNYEKLTVAQLV